MSDKPTLNDVASYFDDLASLADSVTFPTVRIYAVAVRDAIAEIDILREEVARLRRGGMMNDPIEMYWTRPRPITTNTGRS